MGKKYKGFKGAGMNKNKNTIPTYKIKKMAKFLSDALLNQIGANKIY